MVTLELNKAIALYLRTEPGEADHRPRAVAVWAAMSQVQREVLVQVAREPVWDGDVVSKSARDDLLTAELAVRCMRNMEQGYTAASYAALAVLRAGEVVR